jgi:hypothetical protein
MDEGSFAALRMTAPHGLSDRQAFRAFVIRAFVIRH